MSLNQYRRVLAVPGLSPLMALTTLARIPNAAAAIALTLYVVIGLHHGYAAAGVLTAALTLGIGIGGPWRGALIDRLGVRRAMLPSIPVQVVFWGSLPWLSYETMLLGAFLSGLFAMPVNGLPRQIIGARVPENLRQTAFALDSVLGEIAFMVGPLLGVLAITYVPPTVGLVTLGAFQIATGLALMVVNPSVRPDSGPIERVRGGRREWFTPRFVGVLLLMTASTLALGGSDVTIVAVLRDQGAGGLVGLVLAVWAAGSIAGGVLYGGMSRSVRSATLVIGLGLGTAALGLAYPWWVLALALLPVGALCAPSISATVSDVNRLVPAARRGEALGWHSTAATLGIAAGSPLAGFAIDNAGPGWGFVITGGVGVLLALTAIGLGRIKPNRAVLTPTQAPILET